MIKKKVAILLGPGFEDSELQIPFDRLRAAGHHVEVIGPQEGEELRGLHGRVEVLTTKAISQVRPGDYDALLIPGGYSPDHLRADRRFVEFVRRFDALGRPVAAVCHGPQLLIAAGLVKGRTLTAWTTIQEDLRQLGANVRDEAVVVDRHWVTSRKPEDLEVFSDALLQALASATPRPELPSEQRRS